MAGTALSLRIEDRILLDDVFLVDVGNTSVGLVPSLVHGSCIVALWVLLVLAAAGTLT